MKTTRSENGFTLVELLVVIVTLAVLIAVAVPTFATSKENAQAARCMANLKQLTAAWATYTTDNRGRLVANGTEGQQAASPIDPTLQPGGAFAQWCPGRQDETSQLSAINAATNIGYQWIQAGLLYPYVRNVGAYRCPSDTYTLSTFGSIYPHVRSVSMNTWLAPFTPYNGTATVESYYKDADLVRPGPAQLFVYMDENTIGINDASITFLPGLNQFIDCPATYHNGAAGLSFADGHVDIKRWTDSAILVRYSQLVTIAGNPSNLRVSADVSSADLTFLQKASTYVK